MWMGMDRLNSHNGHMGYSPVACHGEYGTMDGRQTVPRAEMTAVIRALMAIKQFGHGVTHATIWSDSKIVVNGVQ
eukprot:762761-Karenia_brevis.AAC.1